MPTRHKELVVIGAGSMRTGTLSQKAALEILLGQPCYHMKDVVENGRRHIPLWIRAIDSGLTKPMADQLFDGFASCVDYPAAHFYRDLMHLYPNARVILSVRDPKSWAQSVQESIMMMLYAISTVPYPLRWLLGMHNFHLMMWPLLRREFGPDLNLADADLLARQFVARNEAVRRAVPPDRLLEFHVSDGWGPLCRFLGLPVPQVPFPRLNDRDRVQTVVRSIFAISYLANATIAVGTLGLGLWLGRRLRLL